MKNRVQRKLTKDEIVQGMREALVDPEQDDEALFTAATMLDRSTLSDEEARVLDSYMSDPDSYMSDPRLA
jgi:hypothetical protein